MTRLRNDLMALGLLAVVVVVALSLYSFSPADAPSPLVFPQHAQPHNLVGEAGARLAWTLVSTLGCGAYALAVGLLMIDLRLFARGKTQPGLTDAFGWCLVIAAVCVASQTLFPTSGPANLHGSGGLLGAQSSLWLSQRLTGPGIIVLVSSCAIAGILLTGQHRLCLAPMGLAVGISRLLNRTTFGPDEVTEVSVVAPVTTEKPKKRKPIKLVETPPAEDPIDEPVEDEEPIAAPSNRSIKVNPPATTRSSRERMLATLEKNCIGLDDEEFGLPEASLLEESEEFPYELLAKKARIAAATLEKTFLEFGLNVRVVEVDTGPVITQFELELEAGLRLSKVTALADDLAIALRVPSVRVVAPIPGKNTVGVEVPNEKQVMVRLRELLESCPQELDSKRLPLFLGKDVSGRPMVVDMTKMPHLLIAGRTGTGKSVCLNTLILSLLMTRTPEQVKLLMIDPKMVELSPYQRVPHLMHPVITDMKKAEAVLAWAVEKMEERYDLLARCGVRHLDGYNRLGREKVLQRAGIEEGSEEAAGIAENMPYIVIIADEMADMMMTSGKDVEGHIIRLAQKSRAVGIHLVLATQKPSVDVITGLIKSNLPARISFQVASRTDSRVVLDEMGAERLLGNGDMLYLAPGTSNLHRAQGTFVSDDEVNTVIDFYGDREPEYHDELVQLHASVAGEQADADTIANRDELYSQAIDVVVREGRGSVSLLQRALGIGYGRAARLVDYMAEDGIVGEYNGSQAREVLYSLEQWEELKSNELMTPSSV